MKFVARVVAVVAVSLGSASATAGILVTGEAPGVQKSQVAGVATMGFNSPEYGKGAFPSLSSPIGDYSAVGPGVSISRGGGFGGASTTGLPSRMQTQFMFV